jgi:Flp pilus assembly pilin Flp
MTNFCKILSSRASKGAALVEYGVLVGLISAVAISAVVSLGDEVQFDYLVTALEVHEISSPLGNYLDNGDFDDVSGMVATSWGYSGSTLFGWTSKNGEPFELHQSGWQGMTSVNGNYWLDTNSSPGAMDIEQYVTGLNSGEVYRLTLFAGDRDPDLDGLAMVFWNGSFVGYIDPTVEDVMQKFDFHIQEGDGDGSNRIRIVDTGHNDANGLSLDQVRIWGR